MLDEGHIQTGVSYSVAFGTVKESTNGVPLSFRIRDWQTRLGGCTSVVLKASVRHHLIGENREVIGYVKPGVYQARGRITAFPSDSSNRLAMCVWTTNWPAVALRDKLVYYTEKHRMRDDANVVYCILPAGETQIMSERVNLLWHLDADWLRRLLNIAVHNAPNDPQWARYRDMQDAAARLSAVWDHLIGAPPLCDTLVCEGPMRDSYEITTTRASAERFPIRFDSDIPGTVVVGPWWESKKAYPSVIDGHPVERGATDKAPAAVRSSP